MWLIELIWSWADLSFRHTHNPQLNSDAEARFPRIPAKNVPLSLFIAWILFLVPFRSALPQELHPNCQDNTETTLSGLRAHLPPTLQVRKIEFVHISVLLWGTNTMQNKYPQPYQFHITIFKLRSRAQIFEISLTLGKSCHWGKRRISTLRSSISYTSSR